MSGVEFTIVEDGEDFCVTSDDGARVLGRYDTEEEAQKRLDEIEALRLDYSDAEFDAFVDALEYANFNPNQPRGPKGSPQGGEWTDGGGHSGDVYKDGRPRPPKRPVPRRGTGGDREDIGNQPDVMREPLAAVRRALSDAGLSMRDIGLKTSGMTNEAFTASLRIARNQVRYQKGDSEGTPLYNELVKLEKALDNAHRVAQRAHRTFNEDGDMKDYANFNPNQPRGPKGSPQGGEWVDSGGGSDEPGDSIRAGRGTKVADIQAFLGKVLPGLKQSVSGNNSSRREFVLPGDDGKGIEHVISVGKTGKLVAYLRDGDTAQATWYRTSWSSGSDLKTKVSAAMKASPASPAKRGSILAGWERVDSARDLSEDDPHAEYAEDATHHTIEGVEIFRVGKWNGDDYGVSDLDQMVEAFSKVGYHPPVKVGHTKDPTARAYGWVKNLRRKDDKLVADFCDVPKEIYNAIKDRGFDAVSSEIFWNLKRDGKTYNRALKAVALLGAEVPAVSGLAPLRTVVHNSLPEAGFDRLTAYTVQPTEWNMPEIAELEKKLAELTTKLEASESARAKELAESEKAREAALKAEQEKREAAEKRLSVLEEERRQAYITKKVEAIRVPAFRPAFTALYDVATSKEGAERVVSFKQGDKTEDAKQEAVLDALVAAVNKHAEKLFTEFSQRGASGDRGEQSAFDDPSVEVDRRVRDYIQKNPSAKYEDATDAVLAADPELRKAYSAVIA